MIPGIHSKIFKFNLIFVNYTCKKFIISSFNFYLGRKLEKNNGKFKRIKFNFCQLILDNVIQN